MSVPLSFYNLSKIYIERRLIMLKTIYKNCAIIDVHKKTIVVRIAD